MMQIIVIHNKADRKEFRLTPETEIERLALKEAQKSADNNPRMIYAGRCEGVDRHIRFNVGGTVRIAKNGEKGCAPGYETKDGTTIAIKPSGENAEEAFEMMKFLGICNTKISVKEFANGLICKAKPFKIEQKAGKQTKHKRS